MACSGRLLGTIGPCRALPRRPRSTGMRSGPRSTLLTPQDIGSALAMDKNPANFRTRLDQLLREARSQVGPEQLCKELETALEAVRAEEGTQQGAVQGSRRRA